MNNRKSIRLFLVDDHEIITAGLQLLLARNPSILVCGNANSVENTINAVRDEAPDVMIVDLELPDGNGMEVIQYVKQYHPQVQSIVYTAHSESTQGIKALQAGAKGFVHKSRPVSDLQDAIYAVCNHEIYTSDQLKQQILNRHLHACSLHDIASVLTKREMQVFSLIGQGLRPRHIAGQLNISISTFDTHCKNIRSKLQLDNIHQVIAKAVEWNQQG